MELRNLRMVKQAADLRDQLIAQRDLGLVEVVIQGKYQDDAMRECVRPAIVAELNRRIAACTADLVGLGVVVDEVRR